MAAQLEAQGNVTGAAQLRGVANLLRARAGMITGFATWSMSTPPADSAPADAPSDVSGSGDTRSYAGGIVALVLGGVALTVGTAEGAAALSDRNNLADVQGCPKACPASVQSSINSMHTSEIVADVGFGAGLAGVALGVVLLVTASSSTPASAPVSVDVEPGVLGLRGRF